MQNRRLQEEKLVAYGNLIHAWRALVREPKRAIQPEEEQILHDIESHLTLVAGPQVLRQYHRLKEIQREADLQSQDVFTQLEKVILEIRPDIGYADWGCKNGHLISVLFEFPAGESKHLKHSPFWHEHDEKRFLRLRLGLCGWLEARSAVDFAKPGHGLG